MHNIIIRPVTPDDAANILAYTAVVVGESKHLSFGSEGISLTVEEEKALITSMDTAFGNRMVVAVKQDEIVGLANLNREKRIRVQHRSRIGISVRKAYWGQGIGSLLMQDLIDHAKGHGIEVISLEVLTTNQAAIGLYHKFGFQSFGTYKNFVKLDVQYYDANYMNLYL